MRALVVGYSVALQLVPTIFKDGLYFSQDRFLHSNGMSTCESESGHTRTKTPSFSKEDNIRSSSSFIKCERCRRKTLIFVDCYKHQAETLTMVDFDGLFQGSLFFVSGVVVILAIVGIVYCISYCFDSAGGNELLTPNELEARRLAPILVQQAGLAGLLKHEQTKIIKFHFEVNSYPYVKENNASKARNDESSPKEDKETTTSADEKSEKTVENQEDDVDKETQSVEEGKIEDAASEANDTKDKVDEEVQTPKDEEIENTTDASAETEQAESPPAESIEKSEDSPEDGSPTPEETTSESKL